MSRLLILATLLMTVVVAYGDNKLLLEELDQTISQRDQYIQAKETKIAYLKEQMTEENDATALLKTYSSLFNEYYVFKFDSAMVYANKGLALAQQSNNRKYSTIFLVSHRRTIRRGFGYS